MKASNASTPARRFLGVLTLTSSKIPAVELPYWRLSLKSRLAWTLTILTLYFFLSNIPLFGLSPLAMELFSRWRAIFAGKIFSLTALGITPILSASILTQILAGRKVLKLDLSEPEEQALYLNMQKFLVVIFAALVSLTYVVVFYQPDPALSSEFGTLTVLLLLFSEVFAGGMLIYFMDSVVSRWGIGSGVGLFILADVSQAMFAGLVNPEMEVGYGGNLWAIGVIPRLIQIIFMPESIGLTGGVYEKLTIDFLFASGIIALIATIAVFFAIIYVESMRLSVKVPGFRRRKRLLVPVKFVYFTYIFFIPLMFALDILHIIQAIGKMLYARGITILGTYDEWVMQNQASCISFSRYTVRMTGFPLSWQRLTNSGKSHYASALTSSSWSFSALSSPFSGLTPLEWAQRMSQSKYTAQVSRFPDSEGRLRRLSVCLRTTYRKSP